jgi:uncharacterized protein involved in high-affinity Fe2+ transport
MLIALTVAFAVVVTSAAAAEFNIGEPVVANGIQIVPNYLLGIEMDRMPPGGETGPDAIHLEADIHATAAEAHGFPEDAWMPYLTVRYTLTKDGSTFKKTGTLAPMTAGDGPHYANGIVMAGPGIYQLRFEILPPSTNGFIRHTDKATGVPAWWKPITAHWTFVYPGGGK